MHGCGVINAWTWGVFLQICFLSINRQKSQTERKQHWAETDWASGAHGRTVAGLRLTRGPWAAGGAGLDAEWALARLGWRATWRTTGQRARANRAGGSARSSRSRTRGSRRQQNLQGSPEMGTTGGGGGRSKAPVLRRNSGGGGELPEFRLGRIQGANRTTTAAMPFPMGIEESLRTER